MDRAEEPAEIDLRDDRPHAFEGLVGRGLVIQGQEDPRNDLDSEEKQRHSAQEVEDLSAVDGHAFMGRQRGGGIQAQPLEEEGLEGLFPTGCGFADLFRLRIVRLCGRQ